MYLAIVSLPGISCMVGGVLGRKCGRKGVSKISSGCIWLGAILALIGEWEVLVRGSEVSIKVMRWAGLERMDIDWGIEFDGVSMTMALVVLSVSGIVHTYSNWYLEEDSNKIRYLSYLSLFTWMMVLMVTADNYILMFVGWEGISGCLRWSSKKRLICNTRLIDSSKKVVLAPLRVEGKGLSDRVGL